MIVATFGILGSIGLISFVYLKVKPDSLYGEEYYTDPNFKAKINALVRKFKDAIKDYKYKQTLVKKNDVKDIAQLIIDKINIAKNTDDEHIYNVEDVADKLNGLSVQETVEFVKNYIRNAHLTV